MYKLRQISTGKWWSKYNNWTDKEKQARKFTKNGLSGHIPHRPRYEDPNDIEVVEFELVQIDRFSLKELSDKAAERKKKREERQRIQTLEYELKQGYTSIQTLLMRYTRDEIIKMIDKLNGDVK